MTKMDSWVSFILGLVESKNIQQAPCKANDKARKFALKSEVCMILQQLKLKKTIFTTFFLNSYCNLENHSIECAPLMPT
ncbi:hypothetical protein D5E86_25415 [Vibrio parahaemolyticus]|nr:hypothetical protein D5E82_24265 [Vibrio parahaemolyticus]TBT15439.1 hypothetical protein D5E83_24385 [Vibrio parahaemolyticus]TBT23641.1 hypothetical protein D5E86_25415 [Vibrio parahaemolyticus]TBT46716.1 hypothetical protein D5E75_24800 [Vibrio parahaemolyticus]TBT50711.1 hypothetical protein D5E76_25500 [Vibrio parahaemolyticus]